MGQFGVQLIHLADGRLPQDERWHRCTRPRIMLREVRPTMSLSPSPAKNLLLTGLPGCGKTTVVRCVIDRLAGLRLAGFYTRELREQGTRVGFEAIGLRGSSVILAHAENRGRHRVGRYGVDLDGFETFIRAELQTPAADADLYVIDEIGRMECLSDLFVDLAKGALGSGLPVLATVATRGGGFIGAVKARPDVEMVLVSLDSRDQLPTALVTRLLRR
jgi:nucleoside-triphosphatase